MNRPQKIIIVLSLVLILFAFLFPPYFVIRSNAQGKIIIDSGWGSLFNFETTKNSYYYEYQAIRPDVLALEILAVVTLGGIALFIFKKPKKLEDEN